MNHQKRIAKKVIIVYILNILRHTSRERPVSQTLICNYLNEIQIPCDRKTVGRNIAYLQAIGYPIKRIARQGYYMDAELLKNTEKFFIE